MGFGGLMLDPEPFKRFVRETRERDARRLEEARFLSATNILLTSQDCDDLNVLYSVRGRRMSTPIEAATDHNEEIEELQRALGNTRTVADGRYQEMATKVFALERFEAEARIQIMNLTEQMRAVIESQKADESELIRDLRRIIKVIGITEIIQDWLDPSGSTEWITEEALCAELYRRWGHLTAGGKRLFAKPPTVSGTTKQMIAEALKRRQEAPNA